MELGQSGKDRAEHLAGPETAVEEHQRTPSGTGATNRGPLILPVYGSTAFTPNPILPADGAFYLYADVSRFGRDSLTTLQAETAVYVPPGEGELTPEEQAAFARLSVFPSGFSATVVSISYWDTASGTYVSTCPSPDPGLRRVMLRVAVVAGLLYLADAPVPVDVLTAAEIRLSGPSPSARSSWCPKRMSG